MNNKKVPYLNWLEKLTHNQEVIGSSPIGTTFTINMIKSTIIDKAKKDWDKYASRLLEDSINIYSKTYLYVAFRDILLYYLSKIKYIELSYRDFEKITGIKYSTICKAVLLVPNKINYWKSYSTAYKYLSKNIIKQRFI